MKHAPTVLVASLALALSACGNDRADDRMAADPGLPGAATTTQGALDTDPMGQAPHAVGAAPTDSAAGTAMPAGGDRNALMAVAEVDRHEIAAAEEALAKGVEGEVRDYAQTLLDDHTRNLEATSELLGGAEDDSGTTAAGNAGGTGTGAVDPELAAMQEKHHAERERLSALEGEEFVSAWIDSMADGHAEALAKLDDELIPAASDPRVSRHLNDTRTAIAEHLETARALQSENR